jgi:hypothetical protein
MRGGAKVSSDDTQSFNDRAREIPEGLRGRDNRNQF